MILIYDLLQAENNHVSCNRVHIDANQINGCNTAKKFCGAEAPGFVNGILGAAAREMKSDAEETNGEAA